MELEDLKLLSSLIRSAPQKKDGSTSGSCLLLLLVATPRGHGGVHCFQSIRREDHQLISCIHEAILTKLPNMNRRWVPAASHPLACKMQATFFLSRLCLRETDMLA